MQPDSVAEFVDSAEFRPACVCTYELRDGGANGLALQTVTVPGTNTDFAEHSMLPHPLPLVVV